MIEEAQKLVRKEEKKKLIEARKAANEAGEDGSEYSSSA